jgi:hypothetical protein
LETHNGSPFSFLLFIAVFVVTVLLLRLIILTTIIVTVNYATVLMVSVAVSTPAVSLGVYTIRLINRVQCREGVALTYIMERIQIKESF